MDIEVLKDYAIELLVTTTGVLVGWGLARGLQQEKTIKKIIAVSLGIIVVVLALTMSEGSLKQFLVCFGFTFALRVFIPKRAPFEAEAYQAPERSIDRRRFVRPAAAAQRLGIPINMVYDLIEAEEIPAMRVNSQYWVDWEELQGRLKDRQDERLWERWST
jgi:hypothetical protein